MKTHNINIFHCLHCGKLAHLEPGMEAPLCCGKGMTNAAAETVPDADADFADRELPAEYAATSAGAKVPKKG